MHTNNLINEKSPYLQQHAHNPVDWYPWGPEAFEKARSEDKPIFLSIGYSTCHWCHVMERESFESEQIAEVLNASFVPVKVDREERPDVDRIYMSFVQASTGGGGWPMSVWLTPDLKPFFGGTYFPPDNRYGRPGFRHILEQLASSWKRERPRIMQASEEVIEQLKSMAAVSADSSIALDEGVLDSAWMQFRRSFDSRHGGFGGAPKFPRPVAYNFLFRYFYRTKTEEAAEMVLHTLREMAKGGMNDQLAGGFHRYSVDARWFVPHFEKMLYDQGQLATSYLEAFQISHDETHAQVARDIFDYVLRDMTHPEGGFYSAEDADSVLDPAHPHEKGEGAFYVWTRAQLDSILGQDLSSWFSFRYGVEPEGNVTEDPHAEFIGKNILYQAHTLEETADHFGIAQEDLTRAMKEAARKLLQVRATRVRPHLDDKILTAWNGLMISALAKGAGVLDEERYLAAAERATEFTLTRMQRDGVVLRRFRQGDAAIEGFLDDYAFFTQALLDLYEAAFDSKYLDHAVKLTDKMTQLFEDSEHGGFYSTAAGDQNLVMRMKEDYDGAEPSGNSIAALNLLRLARITGKESYQHSAERTLAAFATRLKQAPSGVPQMLVALEYSLSSPKQAVVTAQSRDAARPFLRAISKRFLPHHAVSLVPGETPATAHVCENYACQMPTTDVEKFTELLQ